MKWYTQYWGIILVPENDQEVVVLDKIPEQAGSFYEQGEASWTSDRRLLAAIMECKPHEVEMPMGKCLEMVR